MKQSGKLSAQVLGGNVWEIHINQTIKCEKYVSFRKLVVFFVLFLFCFVLFLFCFVLFLFYFIFFSFLFFSFLFSFIFFI